MSIYEIGKRLLPRFARAGLRRTMQQIILPGLAHSEAEPIEFLMRRVRNLEAQVFNLSPPEIVITTETAALIKRFQLEYQIDGPLEVAISKRDTMFRYLEHFHSELPKTYWEYLRTGLQAYQALDALVSDRFGGLEKVHSLLDFASGYGRLTRFLVRTLPPEQVWVSDIKERAVAFQRETFGVEGFASPLVPSDFPPAMRFDVIFVASLFTHLPQKSFSEWLETLYCRLSDRGMLIVSTNDIGQLDWTERNRDFVYRDQSEEVLFGYLDDDAPDGEAYGSTYVSEPYVRGLLTGFGARPEDVTRLPKGLWDSQDLYVIAAAPRDDG